MTMRYVCGVPHMLWYTLAGLGAPLPGRRHALRLIMKWPSVEKKETRNKTIFFMPKRLKVKTGYIGQSHRERKHASAMGKKKHGRRKQIED